MYYLRQHRPELTPKDVVRRRPKPRISGEQRREILLDAAVAAFAEGGYEETTLDEVAVRAGVSKALIYEHFPSKLDLYQEIVETYVEELLNGVTAAAGGIDEGAELRLIAGLEGFLSFVEERRDAWRLLIRHRATDDINETFERLYEEVAGMIGALMAPEMPRSVLPEGVGFDLVLDAMARQLIGAVTAIANWWDEHREVPLERVLEMVMEFAWVGMERAVSGERWTTANL